jgi:cell shape-determining protein MreD
MLILLLASLIWFALMGYVVYKNFQLIQMQEDFIRTAYGVHDERREE